MAGRTESAAEVAGKEKGHEEDLTKPPWGPKGRSTVLGATAFVAQVYLNLLNTTRVHNIGQLYKHIYLRDKNQGLMTVSNHISTVDDPSLFASFLPFEFFVSEHEHQKNRWTMCAKEFCFSNKFLSDYFQNGKVLPIERGKGLDQPTMGIMTERLARGDWIHIFPEGKISRVQKLGSMKWGTAKILCEGGETDPVVLPFYHKGLEKVMPIGSKIPRVGNKNTVVVGTPINFGELLQECKRKHRERKGNPKYEEEKKESYRQIMGRIEESLKKLEKECEALHKNN
mmetsp:Transcript_2054/g.3270  ORF Transcript_2054/g.3270 Transcript_2054/m.3270 type:complete len:284 (-) Transcript_2054:569-1420(-)